MTKKKRIAQLEAEVEALRDQIAELGVQMSALIVRLAMLEAGVGHTVKVDADGWVVWDTTLSRCTCGTSAVCPIHGPTYRSYTVYPAELLAGTASERIT